MNAHDTRLIEVAFPLKQASLDSVREKYGPRGHISGFHLWPARRPLAACRAVLIATLLPNPKTLQERKRLLEKIGGVVVQKIEKKKIGRKSVEVIRDETIGGILRWGRESSPELDWFRQEIRNTYGERAPKVLDPFAGGGAIPLEAMRIGCEVTAADINPVAWFILKCTLEYPQKLTGKYRRLPGFAVELLDFMEEFFKSTNKLTKKQLERNLQAVQMGLFPLPEVDLAWHVRAWGWWVLQHARADLERFYPTIDNKPTVAYLWARTVACKNCRAMVPLLKTRWLCKKDNKRVVLTMEPHNSKTGVVFGIKTDVPHAQGNSAQRREHDKRIGSGTMSRSGVTCPCCGTIMTMEDIRLEGQVGRLGAIMTAVVVDSLHGKEYRLPTAEEVRLAYEVEKELDSVFTDIPFGIPEESVPQGASRQGGGSAFTVYIYGFRQWRDLFTSRQLLALGTFVKYIRAAREAMHAEDYSPEWVEAIGAYMAAAVDRLVDHSTSLATWYIPGENVKHTFVRYALPITWDFAESNTIYEGGGSWSSAVKFCSAALDHVLKATAKSLPPTVDQISAINDGLEAMAFDLIITDPPYYDAIPYSDLMDCFYIWLRRSIFDMRDDFKKFSMSALSPKWDHNINNGELIDDASRHGGDTDQSKAVYEDGMFRAFRTCRKALKPEGRLVIVFAHKQPDAWEVLVSAMIRAGFVVDASWPIQTENITKAARQNSLTISQIDVL